MGIVIKNVFLNGARKDVYVENGKFCSKFDKSDYVIDGSGKAILPSFVNLHGHCAMSFFRGIGDDLDLKHWLNKAILPLEKKLTSKIVYDSAKLSMVEMIRSGTTTFMDMYLYAGSCAKAASDIGLRGYIGGGLADISNELEFEKKLMKKDVKDVRSVGGLCKPVISPHAIYTVSSDLLSYSKEYANKEGLLYQIHLSETKTEVDKSIRRNGLTPANYLDKLGVLDRKTILAHCVWLTNKEKELIGSKRVSVVHCPCSNMKLDSMAVMDYKGLKHNGVLMSLGVDGPSSNNSLSMFSEMKVGCLGQKMYYKDPKRLSASECFKMATYNGYKTLGLNGGIIKEGKIADFMLVDLKSSYLMPNHNLVSNMVYSADSSVVCDVVCNGKFVMRDRVIKDEDKIKERFNKTVRDFYD
jgi:5-methylthioadenosine/S-adenosylhomocysteine deaminase